LLSDPPRRRRERALLSGSILKSHKRDFKVRINVVLAHDAVAKGPPIRQWQEVESISRETSQYPFWRLGRNCKAKIYPEIFHVILANAGIVRP
jgi:hypothetical protein